MLLFLQVAKNCEVGPWSQWGDVNVDGIQMRNRVVTYQDCGGGKPCPPLTQTRRGKDFHIRKLKWLSLGYGV